jgi:hypothetical protein
MTPEESKRCNAVWQRVKAKMTAAQRKRQEVSVLTAEEQAAIDRAIADPSFPSLPHPKQVFEAL